MIATVPTPATLEAARRPWLLGIVAVAWALHMAKGFLLPVETREQFWTLDVAYFVVLPALLAVAARVATGLPFRELLSPVLPPWPTVSFAPQFAAALWMVIVYFVSVVPVRIAAAVWPEAFTQGLPSLVDYRAIAREAGAWQPLAVLYFALTAALVEEYVYRGMLGRYFLDRPDPRAGAYVAVSVALFASFHWHTGLATLLVSIPTGLFAAIVVVRLRRLAPVIVAHFAIDAFAFS